MIVELFWFKFLLIIVREFIGDPLACSLLQTATKGMTNR